MFSFYPQVEYPLAATQLILAMAGMGATLSLSQFRAILWRPHPVGLVLLLQYVVWPVVAALTAWAFSLPVGIAVGLVLMNAVPSGALTNVFTYLGRGNVSLSIVMTCGSTALCFIATPLALEWLTALPGDFRMPIDQTLYPVVMFLLLPLSAGALIARFCSQWKDQFSKWAVRASLVPLTMIVVGALGSGRIDVTEYGLGIPVLLVVFIFTALVLTRRFAMLIGYNWTDAFTMGIEVAIRNGNLAVALVATFFPATLQNDPIGRAVFFVALFYAGATMVIALISVASRRIRLARHERAESQFSQPDAALPVPAFEAAER